MKRPPVALFAIGMLAACSIGESQSVNPGDIEVLRAVLAPSCERDDGKYVVLSSQPASDGHWTIPGAWRESDRISAASDTGRNRNSSGLQSTSVQEFDSPKQRPSTQRSNEILENQQDGIISTNISLARVGS
jgi:hypothetical protein